MEPTLQLRKLRFREVHQFARTHIQLLKLHQSLVMKELSVLFLRDISPLLEWALIALNYH